MACAGALTSMIMTAVGAWVANGGLAEVFGGAPIGGTGGDLGLFNDSNIVAVGEGSGVFTNFDPGPFGVGFNDLTMTANSMVGADAVGRAVSATTGQGWYQSLTNTLTSMKDAVIEFTAPMREAWNTISTAPAAAGKEVYTSVLGTHGPATAAFAQTLTESTFNTAIGMATSAASKALGGTGSLVAGVLMGNPDKLSSIFGTAQGFVNAANDLVTGATRGAQYLGNTFTSMSNAISGGIAGVSNYVKGLGTDIEKMGGTFAWEDVSNIGSPGQLVKNVESQGTLGPLYKMLGDIRVDEKTAQQLGVNVANSVFRTISGQGDFKVTDLLQGVNLNSLVSSGRPLTESGRPLTAAEIELRRLADEDNATFQARLERARQHARIAESFRTAESFSSSVPLKVLGVDLNALARKGANLPAVVQKQIYDGLGKLTENEVKQVKAILDNTQAAVQKGQDLLDPRKLFAGSFETLTTPIRTASMGFRSIYQDSTGAVNPQLNHLGKRLKGIIPDDLAVANDALARSLMQIKGITNTSTKVLANTVSGMENLEGLPLIQDQTQYVMPAVANYWNRTFNQDLTHNSGIPLSTGIANTYTLCDVIGFAAGYNSALPLSLNAPLQANLVSAGAFAEFTDAQGIYETIQEFCAGTFGPEPNPYDVPGNPDDDFRVVIPAGWAAAGTYYGANAQVAFQNTWTTGIIPVAAVAATDIYENYPDAQRANLNETIWQYQFGREILNRQRAGLDLDDIVPNQRMTIAMVQNLPNLGTDTSFGGTAMWLERTANTRSLGGQAVIAAMREGRNQKKLEKAGLGQDLSLPNEAIQVEGVLFENQYNTEQALARIVHS